MPKKSEKKSSKTDSSQSREDKRKNFWLKQLKSGKTLEQTTTEPTTEEQDSPVEEEEGNKNKRYILFIGNLPFSASKEDVLDHFNRKGIHATDVRMLTKRGSDEPRGCAFMELQNAKHQQIALRFHHTKFKGRQINVEMTCGGGGASEERRERIKQKNEKVKKQLQKKKLAIIRTKRNK